MSASSTQQFDRAAIFRSAHAHARREIKWASFKGTYRQAFAIALRAIYYAEKEARAEAAYQATLPPIPADVVRRVSDLRDQAWGCRIDGPGNAMHAALLAEARDLEHAARGFI